MLKPARVLVPGILLLAFMARADTFTPGGIGFLPDGQLVEEGMATFDPGSGDPWHYHPGNVWVIIVSGELTEERGCGTKPVVHRAGQAFHEPPGVVHQVTNTGLSPAVIIFTGVLPACFTNFNDQINVDGPSCDGDGDRIKPVRGPYPCPL